ncbi:MAG: hypothetical protein LBQ93_02360 [Treponema sp.]|jgi:glucan phosphoethanolaminetransferase (alkaline phosphatase superfamily)|nr:hypothetical protein [Treponema sp.]
MRKRISGLVYVFCLFTGGIYFIYWILSLVLEINKYFNEEKIKFKILLIKFISVFVFYSILFFNLFRFTKETNKLFIVLFFVCFVLAIYWLCLIINTIVKIVKNIYIIQENEKIEMKLDKALCLVLFFVYFIGIIYLQMNINKIADKNNRNNIENL